MTTPIASADSDATARLVPAFLAVVGVLLLADSLSQLVAAVGPWHIRVGAWRVASLKLFFSQVTPLTLGTVLVLVALPPRAAPWRVAGVVLLGVTVAVIGLGVRLWGDASVLRATLDGPALGEHKVRTAQGLLSATAMALGFAGFAVASWRQARQAEPGNVQV